MTGTALSDAAELQGTYNLLVTPVPTALPVARRDYPDVAFKTRNAADLAMVKEIENVGGGEGGGTSLPRRYHLRRSVREDRIVAGR